MAVFLSASDETKGDDGTGSVTYAGFVAPYDDWQNHFVPAWSERVLGGHPAIPYLHMTDVRSPKWREQFGLTRYAADARVEEAVRVIDSMGSLYPVSMSVNATWFNSIVKANAPKNKASFSMQQPDFLCYLGYAFHVLDSVVHEHPDAERVDFLIEDNDKVTDRIMLFHEQFAAQLTALNRQDLVRLIGQPVPGDKDAVPLQAADVFCWHVQRHERAVRPDREDERRYTRLAGRIGFADRWLPDLLAQFTNAALAHSERS